MDCSSPANHINTDDFHRGHIDHNGQVKSVCSLQWLLTLSLEIHRARSFTVVDLVRQCDRESHVCRLQMVNDEIKRLLDYPQLFCNKSVRVRFLAMIALDSELQFHEACKNLLLKSEEAALERFSDQKLVKPNYIHGCKGWENFLLNLAPGAPKSGRRAVSVPKSSFQAIPTVGLRIVTDLEREEREIVRYVQHNQDQFDVRPAQTTLLVNFDKPEAPEEMFPELMLPQQSFPDVVRPSPYQDQEKIRLDLPLGQGEPVEAFGPFIYRLDYPAQPPHFPVAALNGPDSFHMISLRTWHPPYLARDLELACL